MRSSMLSGLLTAAALGLGSSASALTLTLSSMSSEPVTNPAVDLLADVSFSVSACGVSSCTLTITLDNRTDENLSGVTYDINELGFNAVFAVVGSADLTFLSATKNGVTDVTAGWTFSEQTANPDVNTHLDGFGVFDFALKDGVGPAASQANPGDMIAFVFTAPAGITDTDFDTLSAQTPTGNQMLKTVAAKFVEMDPVGFNTCGATGDKPCDSAYGGVPEPAVTWLLGLGIAGLLLSGRKRA